MAKNAQKGANKSNQQAASDSPAPRRRRSRRPSRSKMPSAAHGSIDVAEARVERLHIRENAFPVGLVAHQQHVFHLQQWHDARVFAVRPLVRVRCARGHSLGNCKREFEIGFPIAWVQCVEVECVRTEVVVGAQRAIAVRPRCREVLNTHGRVVARFVLAPTPASGLPLIELALRTPGGAARTAPFAPPPLHTLLYACTADHLPVDAHAGRLLSRHPRIR